MKERIEIELRLNMQMIVDDLEDEFNIYQFYRRRDRQKLRGACIYYGQTELNPAFAYVAAAAEFEAHPITDPEICVISVGRIQGDRRLCPGPLIEVNEEASWQEVFNLIQATFSRYFIWAQRLSHILSSGGGLYELCVAALDFFQNPLYVHDPNFNVLAMPMWVVGMSNFITNETNGNTTLPLSKVQAFENNSQYIKTLSTRGAHLWVQEYMKSRSIYVNIWSKQHRYCGRLLINELNTSFKPSQFAMAEYFAKFLVAAFEQSLYKTNASAAFETILQKMLKGTAQDESYLFNRLKMVNWERKHQYVCFVCQLKNAQNTLVTCRKISSTISIFLKESFSFSQDNVIYTVCNLTRSGYAERDCREKMLELCGTAEVRVGASDPFRDFLLLREYYLQALKALELGAVQAPDEVYHPFHNYVLDYILHHFSSEFSVQTICSNAVKDLIAMDQEKNTDYVRTLWCYLDTGCHQTAAAQAMYIHRSTLIYRLDKIEEYTGVDLSDADTRLYLQISLKLLQDQWMPPQEPSPQ